MIFDNWFPLVILRDDISGESFQKIQLEIKNALPEILNLDLSNPWKDTVQTSFKFDNNNIIESFNFECLKSKIIDNVNHMLDEYDSLAYGFKLTESWINISKHGNFQFEHDHPECDISGVYYYQADTNSGNIVFRNPNPYAFGKNFNKTKTQTVSYEPIAGRMILFPSWLTHRVDINNANTDRVSFTFNIKLTNNKYNKGD